TYGCTPLQRGPVGERDPRLAGHGRAAGGEVDALGDEALDTLAAPDFLVLDADVRFLLGEDTDPLAIEGSRERRAGALQDNLAAGGRGRLRARGAGSGHQQTDGS